VGFDIEQSGAFARVLSVTDSRLSLSADDGLRQLLVSELVELAGGQPPAVVSVDIFDTLLLRNGKCEARRYWEISELIHRRLGVGTGRAIEVRDLFLARYLAMRAGYCCGESIAGCREGQIAHVLATQIELLGLSPTLQSAFLEIELEYEAQNLIANYFLLAAIQAAFGPVPIVGISDMYLSAEHIEVLVARLFADRCTLGGIFSSADLILNKRSGHAYPVVAGALNCNLADMIHVGDNAEADVSQPRRVGMKALLFPVADSEYSERRRDLNLFVEERLREGLDCGAYASL